MRYDIREGVQRIDFTWEREWRIRCDELRIDNSVAEIVVADATWADRLLADHEHNQDYEVIQYGMVVDHQLAEMFREPFRWTVLMLR